MEQYSDFRSLVRSDVRVGHGPAQTYDTTIVMCLDQSFVFYARVALTSMLLNTPSRRFSITLIARGLSPDDVVVLDRLGRTFGVMIRIIGVEYGVLGSLQLRLYWSSAVYLRWLAPCLVTEPIILYLDADLIVQADIETLLALYQPGKMIGGVEDLRGASSRRAPLGLPQEEPYLNTGVLLIDAERWRAQQITAKAISFTETFEGTLSGVDQDALNCVLLGEKYVIPNHWNVQTFTVGYYGLEKRYNSNEFEGIFHFSGEVKPWMRWAGHWSRKFYAKYALLVEPKDDYWIEPRTVKEKLLYARAADEEGDVAKANAARRQVLAFLLRSVNQSVLERSMTS